jgi:lactoylglutathione lyase
MIPAREIRFVLVSDDFEATAHLYRDVFGLDVLMDLEEQAGRGVILKVPAATLELVDSDHERMIDELQVGRPLDERVRIAVKVDELADASRAVTDNGATAMAPPVGTPWGRPQPEVSSEGRHAAHRCMLGTTTHVADSNGTCPAGWSATP